MKFYEKIKVPRLVVLAAIAAAVVAADQITKFFASAYLKSIYTFPLIDEVLHFTYIENEGAAFGMLSNNRWVFMVFSSVALVAIAVFAVLNRRGNMMTNVAVAMIFGGGVGCGMSIRVISIPLSVSSAIAIVIG